MACGLGYAPCLACPRVYSATRLRQHPAFPHQDCLCVRGRSGWCMGRRKTLRVPDKRAAACRPPGGGRNDILPLLLTGFNTVSRTFCPSWVLPPFAPFLAACLYRPPVTACACCVLCLHVPGLRRRSRLQWAGRGRFLAS
jgi:hypothetical protein